MARLWHVKVVDVKIVVINRFKGCQLATEYVVFFAALMLPWYCNAD